MLYVLAYLLILSTRPFAFYMAVVSYQLFVRRSPLATWARKLFWGHYK